MTPEQRYLLDTMGYLHLKDVLGAEEFKMRRSDLSIRRRKSCRWAFISKKAIP